MYQKRKEQQYLVCVGGWGAVYVVKRSIFSSTNVNDIFWHLGKVKWCLRHCYYYNMKAISLNLYQYLQNEWI